VRASVVLQGALPGEPADLVTAIVAAVPSADAYAVYLAELIVGRKEEVPMRIADSVEFRTVSFAQAIGADDLCILVRFLGLRNLLRLYDVHVPLQDRVTDHRTTIATFVDYLTRLVARDARCAHRLTGEPPVTTQSAQGGDATRMPHVVEFLVDLRRRGDWTLLEAHAARFVPNDDRPLARMAKACLAESLMHSDEAVKRHEAVRHATSLISDPDATAADFLLAAGCSKVVGDDGAAVGLAKRALATWGDDADVRTYARGLALRSGDTGLRAAVDRETEDTVRP
jgi:hypothetical protein